MISIKWVEVLTFAFTIAFTVVSYQAANQETRAISWVEGFILSLIQIISFIFAIYNVPLLVILEIQEGAGAAFASQTNTITNTASDSRRRKRYFKHQ